MTSTQEFTCIFCNENFENKEELQTHFRKHGDPKFNDNMKNKSRFENEAQTSDGKSNDNMVSCDVCSEVFPSISKAITHKHKVHPDHDTKYFCPWCGKLFTLKHLYDKHIQTNHESSKKIESRDLHCDICDVNFYVVSAMLYHNKFFHRQDTDLPAVGHSKKQRLIFQELLPIYCCPFCGEEYNNKVNLHKHIGDDHIDENQSPDEVLRCPLCEAILYHLDAYELHLTCHKSDDMYSETNELNTSELSEFSLETVPPIMEKVENCETGDDVESTMNTMGIENFLQFAMDESVDNDNLNAEQTSEKVKSKKHKKHKKSKKSAITLDEFLNMNKDVFGEGLDIQGVEEVPTKLVTKQLKNKRQTQMQKQYTKLSSSKDLEKLRKQGIIVKPTKKPLAQTIKIGSKVAVAKPIKIANPSISNKSIPQTKLNSISASNEVLSKLINQSNNQIKIVKKSSQEVSKPDTVGKNENPASPKNLKVQDTQKNSNTFDSEIEGNNEEKHEQISNKQMDTRTKENRNEEDKHDEYQETKAQHDFTESEIPENDNKNELLHEDSDASDDGEGVANNDYKTIQSVHKDRKIVEPRLVENKSLNDPLKKINQQITVKSVILENDNTHNNSCLEKDSQINKCEYNDNSDDNEKGESIPGLAGNSKKTMETVSAATSLNSLKYLGNLTIKPVIQNKAVAGATQNIDNSKLVGHQIDIPQESQQSKNFDDKITSSETKSFKNETTSKKKPEEQKETSKSLDALKNLSKHITIKSLTTQPQNKIIDEKSNDGYTDDENNIEEEENSNNGMDCSDIKLNAIKIVNSEGQAQSTSPLRNIKINKSKPKIIENQANTNGQDMMIKHTGATILKNLKSVTAKPMSVVKQNNAGSLSYSTDVIKKEPLQKCEKTEKMNKEIEVFNIDDSDSDEAEKSLQSRKQYKPTQIIQKNTDQGSTNSTDVLKSISKQITVKSATQPSQMHRITRHDSTYKYSNISENYSDGNKTVTKESSQKSVKQDLVIQNALKNLGEHITVKSRNSSPNTSVRYQNTQDSDDDDIQTDIFENDDSNSCSNRIKITEINEDECATDDDIPLKQLNDNTCKGIVQSPHESSSDHEEEEEFNEQLSDIESQIKANRLNKPNQNVNLNKQSLHLDALRNISKNITIKSLNDKNTDNCNIKVQNRIKKIESEAENNPTTSGTLAKAPFKQRICQDDSDNVALPHKIQQNNSLIMENSVDHSAMNQTKVSTLANETTDTVNKEVVVKTFQTKTVIQEITTTVTKTIKTVNQTMQHEIRSSNQCTSTPIIRTPKNVQIRPQQQVKNFQGITIRHASPNQPRIRNVVPQRPVVRTPVRPSNQLVPVRPSNQLVPIRPSNQLVPVRPSNQLVPVRPKLNQTRSTAPKTSLNKITPSQSNQQIPRPGKPIKIRPSMSSPTMKRPASEETTGHFSCFKKPRESLIPVSDVPTFSSDKDSESTVQFASVSRMSSSNFNSTTKNVKGNTVVTSVQKSETSTSSQQQMSRLGNMSGIKIMKSSQAKQTGQVEEKCEIIATKRTTLKALEKLQKQGLLVKKPRMETDEYNEVCENSDFECDDET